MVVYNRVCDNYCNKLEIKIFSCKLKYKRGFETEKHSGKFHRLKGKIEYLYSF